MTHHDEPTDEHDARCGLWLSSDPLTGCTCRGADGHEHAESLGGAA